MSSKEWKTYKLGDVTVWKSGGTPKKMNEKFWDGDIPWISAKTLIGNSISDSSIKITKEGLENGSRLADIDSILLLVRGSGLFNRIPIAIVKNKVAFNQDIKEIIANKNKLYAKFLLYWLESITKDLNNKLEETGIGAGKFDTEILKNLEIAIPDFEIQNQIINFIGSLDDKIELNRQTNQTLEGIAQTLFQEMCVPKGEELPEGWRVGKLGEICSVQNGYAFKSNDFTEFGEVRIIKIRNISNNIVDVENTQFVSEAVIKKLDKKFKIEEGSLLIAMTGAEVGKIGLSPNSEKELWLNQRVGMFIENVKFANHFLYILLSSNDYQNILQNTAQGSAQPNISSTNIEEIQTLLPKDNIIEEYGQMVDPLFKKRLFNIQENQTLIALRDSLLPKLMKGEIEI